jgi:hypothetical protein
MDLGGSAVHHQVDMTIPGLPALATKTRADPMLVAGPGEVREDLADRVAASDLHRNL